MTERQEILQSIEEGEQNLRSLRLFHLLRTICPQCRYVVPGSDRQGSLLSIGVPSLTECSDDSLKDELFELVDGLCINPECTNPDTLWPRLMRLNTVGPKQTHLRHKPEVRRADMCWECMKPCFFGICCQGDYTVGECLECRWYILPPGFERHGAHALTTLLQAKKALEDYLRACRACLETYEHNARATASGGR